METSQFLVNKYFLWYCQIIKRAQERDEPALGFEHHHIKPRALGGDNAKKNIARLTYREHFLAHWLLTRFTRGEGQVKMRFALYMMTWKANGSRVISSWQYEIARRAKVEALKKREFSEEHRKRLSEAAKQRKPCIGWHHSEEARKKISANRPKGIKTRGFSGRGHSEETRRKISESCIKSGCGGWDRYNSDPEHQQKAIRARWGKI